MESNIEKTNKALLERLGEKDFKKIFSEIMAIGIKYDIQPMDIISMLSIGHEKELKAFIK